MKRHPIILFDVMDTLVTDPFFTTMPEFFGMSHEELLSAKHPTAWIEFEKGHITEVDYLRWTFVSCLTGVRKPDPNAYLGAAATLQLEPSECLLIDDRAENLEAARAVGMDAILKIEAGQFREELVQRSLLKPRS